MKTKNIKKILPMALVALGALMPFGAAHATDSGWGPQDRPTFTWEKPANYVTFNSITNNPKIGNETNFVRVRKDGTGDSFSDSATLEVGATYTVRIYFHNNHYDVSKEGKDIYKDGMAENVQISTELPEELNAGQAGVVKGIIFSSNAKPTTVWDEAYLKANERVFLRYVPNSAVLHNSGTADGAILDSNSLFDVENKGVGARVAYDKTHWGVIPGCNNYAGYVDYKIKVDKPGFLLEKTVSKNLANDYKNSISANPGDTLDFKISYKNTGTTDQTDVTVYDRLPEGMTYIPGTTYVKTPAKPKGEFVADKLFDGGLVIGDFHAGESAEITYKIKISDSTSVFPCGKTMKINNLSSIHTANGIEYDKVEVSVTRNCDTPTESCYNEDGTLKNTPECNKCINEDGTWKDTPECKCINEDGTPKDTPECKTPETPSELPSTGATEIVFTVVAIVGLWVAGAYWYRSRKELGKLTKGL